MAPFKNEAGIKTLAEILLNEARDQLAVGPYGLPDRIVLAPGAIAWDECDCGQLALSMSRAFLSEEFPTPGPTDVFTPCLLPWLGVEFTIQIVRCAPQPVEGSLAPSVTSLKQSHLQVIDDAYRILNGIHCKLQALLNDDQIVHYRAHEQIVQGPEGACVGSELIALVGLER